MKKSEKLTYKKKIEILERSKEYLESLARSNCYIGICVAIQRCFGIHWEDTFSLIPELLKFKPVNAEKFWFPLDCNHIKNRLDVIDKTIQYLKYESTPWYKKLFLKFSKKQNS